LRQEINLAPIEWGGGSPTPPLVVVGDPGWSNYEISVDVLMEQTGYVELIGRLGAQSESSPGASQGYHLRIISSAGWKFFKEDIGGSDTQLGSGITSFGLNSWHNLSLKLVADTIQAFIDSTLIATVNDGTYGFGQGGLLVSKWQNAEFDNFSVESTGENGWMTIDDAIKGSGVEQFNYIGSGWQYCTGCGSDLYAGSNSWDNTANDYVTVGFSGTQIKFYGVKDPGHGIGAVSIDGGSETSVDFYSATRVGNQLIWTSPVLTAGKHVFKLRVTGYKNTSSTNSWVVPDRVDILESNTLSVSEIFPIPINFSLDQNYPNPFNPSTVINYHLPLSSHVTLKIYDELGREVRILVDDVKPAGNYTIKFDASSLPSGVYFCRLQARNYNETKKLMLLK